MKKNEGSKVDWDTLQMNADKVLGDNCWSKFEHLMPKKIPPIDFYEMEEEGYIFVEAPGITQPETLQIKIQGAHITPFKVSFLIPTRSKRKTLSEGSLFWSIQQNNYHTLFL